MVACGPATALARRGEEDLCVLGLLLTWPHSLLGSKARFTLEALLLPRGGGLGVLVGRDLKSPPSSSQSGQQG